MDQLKTVGLWSVLAFCIVLILAIGVYLVLLLPGAATLFAWDCFSDGACSLSLSVNRYSPGHYRRTDHEGLMAYVMGGMMLSIALIVVGGVANTLVGELRDGAGLPSKLVAAAALLAFDIALVSWLTSVW